MGLMFARKQAAKKQIEANKQRAHAENHRAVKERHRKHDKAQDAESAPAKEPSKKP